MRPDVDPQGQMLNEINRWNRMISLLLLCHRFPKARGIVARREVNPIHAPQSMALAMGSRRLTH